MENLLLLLFFILSYFLPVVFQKTDGAISKRFEKTHRKIVVVGIILGILSLILGMGGMIAFFVFCFAFYTMMCAFRRTKNSNNIPALPVIFTVITFFIFIFLAATFNSIATFFLASVCICYWGVQYMLATK